MGIFKPARNINTSTQDDVICDLDAVLSSRATFTFQGKTHVLLPITTQVFFEFWNKVLAFKEGHYETIEASNLAYFETVKTICDDITLKEIEQMTLLQKSILIEGLAAKVTGNTAGFEQAKKKTITQNPNPDSKSA